MDLIQSLKTRKDIEPEKYDGSYVLIPKVIDELSKIDNLDNLNLDCSDLDAIYFLCIITREIGINNRKERVENSHLPSETKENIIKFIEEEWKKTLNEEYSHRENGLKAMGMFRTGFNTFNSKNKNPHSDEIIKFFKLIIKIKESDDNLENIINLPEFINFEMKGMKKGGLSQFLHCIKPTIFPIVNSKKNKSWGIGIYNKLGVEIDKDDTIKGYIKDIKNIKKFMEDNKFEFKNYRVIDLLGSDIGVGNMNEYIELLKQNKNLILTGAPGTGKTYSSMEIAVNLIDENVSSDRKEIMKKYKELVEKEQIFFTTFHQSMDYEEFVEGIKPQTVGNNITYELKDGIFKKACESANKNNQSSVVLIIDEINRGNISKIFGELITLLEKDKRKSEENEIEAILPYSKEKFSVPNNLYIIGTMNTADRSIGYVDYALRRRFSFIPIKSDISIIENYYGDINKNSDCKDNSIELFNKIKKLIEENLNEEFDIDDIMIGHSYFMAKDSEELQNKLECGIKPLLLEYYKDGIFKSNNDIKENINSLEL